MVLALDAPGPLTSQPLIPVWNPSADRRKNGRPFFQRANLPAAIVGGDRAERLVSVSKVLAFRSS
jgi:hypothetical protein